MTYIKQVGGDHYQNGGEQHWDRIYRLYGRGYFVGCATKYLERYQDKNGKEDLLKAISFIQKLLALEYPEPVAPPLVTGPAVVAADYHEFRGPTYLSNAEFQHEGGWGDMQNLYKCRACSALVTAKSLSEAAQTHGTCPGKGYVAQG